MGHPQDSRLLRRLGRPVGRFNAELLGVLGDQSLPAGELHGIGAGDAPNGLAGEKAVQHIERNVPARSAPRDEAAIDVVPQRQTRAAAERLEFPPDVAELKHIGSVGSRHSGFGCGVAFATQVSFTVAPTVPRLPSTSKGAHSRSCAGSVSACQTFSGGWRSSRTRMSVHFSLSVCPRPFVPAPRWPGPVRIARDRSSSSPAHAARYQRISCVT